MYRPLRVLLLLAVLVLGSGCELLRSSRQAPVQTGPPPKAGAGEVSVAVDEALITSELNRRVAGKPVGQTPLGEVTIRDLRANLRDGQAVIDGSAQAGGASVPVSMTVTFDVQEARPLATVREADVGGVPLPDIAKREIEETIQAQLDQALAQQPLRVRAVHVGDGRLTIVGSPAS